MTNCSKSCLKHHAAEYECVTCDHHSIIFLALNDLFSLMQSDQTSNFGEEEKDTWCDGDLMKR